MKEFVLKTSEDIIVSFDNEDEIEVFNLFSDSIYSNIKNKKAFKDNDASGFGDVQDILTQIVIGIVIDLSKDVIKSGYDLTKESIQKILRDNRKKYIEKYKVKTIEKIEESLSNEKKDGK